MKCPSCETNNLQEMKDQSGRFLCLKCGEKFKLQIEGKKKGIVESIFH